LHKTSDVFIEASKTTYEADSVVVLFQCSQNFGDGNMSACLKCLASILVVVRNNKDAIVRCLQSIFHQSYGNIEVVIVDGSDDDSPLVIRRCIEKCNTRGFKVKYVHAKARGVGAARNTALESSSGKYIFFVDADCYVPRDYVEHAMEIFFQDEKILSINVRNAYFPSEKGIFAKTIHLHERARRAPLSSEHFEHWICRRKVFDLVGLFDDSAEAWDDVEWRLRSEKLFQDLKQQGYKAVMAPDLVMNEEKQGWTVRKYWKKSMWYGGKYANLDYLRADLLTNSVELFLIASQVTYPASLVFHFLSFRLSYLFVLHTLVFVAPTLFTAYRAARRKIVSPVLLVTPFLIFYKSIFLLPGALCKAFKDAI
jgi:glycosyltransferase involved in cell wall biosynthesis